MTKKILAAIFSVAILFSTFGCSTTLDDTRAAKGTGVSRIYTASQDAIWKAVPSVLAELGLQLVSENKQEGYILAQNARTLLSGENVAIFIESAGGVIKTRVEVISKKMNITNVLDIYAPSWEDDILNKLDEKLKLKTKS